MNGGLLANTEARRLEALATLRADDQSRLGQFFTPARAASLIAALPRLPQSGRLRVLDPGAGVGSLTAALVERIQAETPDVLVEIVSIEIDEAITPYLAATMAECESGGAGRIHTTIVRGDFIELSTGLMRDPALAGPFDLVIMNPPYAKLGSRSLPRQALVRHGVDCPNLYAAFMALGVVALAPGGQVVAITPRSFANGTYFEQFRKYLLGNIAIDRLHTFESRSTVFSDTGVLQENIVLSGTRDEINDSVVLSSSRGHTDEITTRVVDYTSVVRPEDPHSFLRIANADSDAEVAAQMASMPATLADLGLDVSTGRVVDFRSKDNLRATFAEDCLPLIYPGNVRDGVVVWPRPIRKPQAFFVLTESDRKLLFPPGHYVVVKRFSAKEERRRLVAAVWDSDLMGNVEVAFENHLNVFHVKGTGLDRDVAVGLSLWLNSSFVDQFFRTFSGHTQVNATDLRTLRFPSLDDVRKLGENRAPDLPEQAEIDRLVLAVVAVTGVAA